MKLLFVISKYYPKVGGTPNCTRNLIHHLRRDHTVQVLTTMDRVDDPRTVSCEGIPVHKERSYAHIAMRDLLHDGTLGKCARWRALIGKTFFRLVPIEPVILRWKFRRRVRRLQKEEVFDWVVAVGGDIVPARAVAGCKGLAHTCFYQLDPYTTNATLPQRRQRQRCTVERKLHSSFNLVLTTGMIKEEMASRFPMGAHVVTCAFPNIMDRTAPSEEAPEQIRCLFCGAMYAARNMERALRIIRRLVRADRRIYFDFYILGDTSQVRRAGAQEDHICLFDPVGPDEIFDVMARHQVLVNIGNVMTNQVPSKIYDYISTGLPILNIAANDDCPTVEVLAQYPLATTLRPCEDEDAAVERALRAIREQAGCRESFAHIQRAYYENTIACVAERMLSNMAAIGGAT